jgi:hypothetical protein
MSILVMNIDRPFFFFFLIYFLFWLTSVWKKRKVFLMIDYLTYQWNLIDNHLFWLFLFFCSLPVVIEVWSIESMWAVSSVFSEHIMISFSHLFHLFFFFMNRSTKQEKIINLELSAFRCQTSIISCKENFSHLFLHDINIADKLLRYIVYSKSAEKEKCFGRARKNIIWTDQRNKVCAVQD